MKRSLVILLLICSLPLMIKASVAEWNSETRKLSFYGDQGAPWLVDGMANIKFTGGTIISTSDKLFRVTVAELLDRIVLSGIDSEKNIDWEIVITSLDNWSARIDMTIFNRSRQPLKLDQIDVLSGRTCYAEMMTVMLQWERKL